MTDQPTTETVLKTIRSRGYWEVRLRPSVFEPKRIGSLVILDEAVQRARVQLRGWDYPHVDDGEITRHKDFIQGMFSSGTHHEVWQLFQSAQFVHVFAMMEDWLAEAHPRQYGAWRSEKYLR